MLFAEVLSFVEELEALGVRFTATAMLDGSARLSCWRLPTAWDNRERINRLIADRIGSSPENADQIARYIAGRSNVRASAAA